MSLKIRMARAGTKKRPVYHIVVADSRYPRDGRFLERLGYFNPLLPNDHESRLKLDIEKAKVWLSKGAQPSDRVLRFLDAAGVSKRPSASNPERALPRKKREGDARDERKALQGAKTEARAKVAKFYTDKAEAKAKAKADGTYQPAKPRRERRLAARTATPAAAGDGPAA